MPIYEVFAQAREGKPFEHGGNIVAPDPELAALYAFVMTRQPVQAETPSNRLQFPFGLRPLLAAWSLLYLDRTPLRPR